MAAAAMGLWNHATAAGATQNKAKAMTDPTGTSGSSSASDSATISANDFLTLLVTEMKNQDPTADTDPNEYINQLVNVNSLEQLIDINQTLTTDSSTTTPTTPTGSSVMGHGASSAHKAGSAHKAAQSTTPTLDSYGNSASGSATSGLKTAPGNLSIPDAKAAAQRVAQALGGRNGTQ
jgi:flagellar basal-body rod modification protein FlgD